MPTLQELDVNYMSDADNPWVPSIPMSEQVTMKYWKIDPARGEVVASMRMPAGLDLPKHYHTGIVIAHTISGAWRYIENNWVSRAGDTVYEVAASSHTPETLEDTEVFFYMVGELLFLDDDQKIVWKENAQTMLDRYNNYCAANGIAPRDLTSFD